MPPWLGWSVLGIAGLIVLLVISLGAATFRWNSATDALRGRLAADGRAPAVPTFLDSELEGLPAPVARFFRAALPRNQRLVTRARVTWSGEFNMGEPGADKWAPFSAIQDFVPGAPGMVWDARIHMAPGVTVRVRDGFVRGEGSMYGAVLGLIPVVDKSGTPEMAVAALQRYLAEAMWLPTALLPSHGVRWTPVDDGRALATISGGGTTAIVEFRFGANGLIDSVFVSDRLFDSGKGPTSHHPWQGRNLRFASYDGMTVPAEAVVEWLLPRGPYAYWRGRPDRIEYEYAAR